MTVRSSIFPHFPRARKIADSEGNMSQHWTNSLQNVYQNLASNFTTTGYTIPQVNSTDLANIQSNYQQYIGQTPPVGFQNIAGQLAYNTDTDLYNQFVIGFDSNNKIILAQWVPLGVTLFNDGTPASHLAGIRGWSCYDYTNNKLYFCTTTGPISSAVWTQL